MHAEIPDKNFPTNLIIRHDVAGTFITQQSSLSFLCFFAIH